MSVNIAIETVARALASQGSADAAQALLRAALHRDPEEPGCADLLRLVEQGSEIEPIQLSVGLDLVDEWTRQGKLIEALTLLVVSELHYTAEGSEWGRLLGELCAPSPRDAPPELRDLHRELYAGRTEAVLRILRTEPGELPPWAARRLALLHYIMRGEEGTTADRVRLPNADLAALLAREIAAGSVHRAYDAAREFRDRQPDDPTAELIVSALKRLITSVTQATSTGPNTMAVDDLASAQFHFIMGNIDEAEMRAKEVVMNRPEDVAAARFLEDLLLLRRIMRGEPSIPIHDRRQVVDDDREPTTAVIDVSASIARMASEAPIPGDSFESTTKMTPIATADYRDGLDVTQMTEELAERLIGEKRFEDALQVYMSLSAQFPKSEYYKARLRALMDALDPDTADPDSTIQRPVSEELRRLTIDGSAPPAPRSSVPVVVSRTLRVGPHEDE